MKKFIVISVFSVLASILCSNETLAGTESNKRMLDGVTERVVNPSSSSPLNKSSVNKTSRREQRKALRVKENKVVEGSRRHLGGYITGVGIVIFILLILLL